MPAKSVPIKLKDGKARSLRFEWEACNLLEEHLDSSIFELAQQIINQKVGFKKTGIIIWAGIFHEGEKLTLEDVVKLLDSTKFTEYFEKIGGALNSLFPEIAEALESLVPESAEKEKKVEGSDLKNEAGKTT